MQHTNGHRVGCSRLACKQGLRLHAPCNLQHQQRSQTRPQSWNSIAIHAQSGNAAAAGDGPATLAPVAGSPQTPLADSAQQPEAASITTAVDQGPDSSQPFNEPQGTGSPGSSHPLPHHSEATSSPAADITSHATDTATPRERRDRGPGRPASSSQSRDESDRGRGSGRSEDSGRGQGSGRSGEESEEQAVQGDQDLVFDVPHHVLERNKVFAERIKGKLVLAPLTRANHLPFRQLCTNLGCDVTMSEMSFAKTLLKGDRVEKARLAKAASEECFGFQIATKVISEGVEASKLAQQAGASWLDINVGCPIYEASRRGVGAVMLRKPRSLAKLIHGIVLGSDLPVTVKIRTGESDRKINVARVAALLARTGAAAITIHGRTMEQRYRKAADWSYVAAAAAASPPSSIPVIGNGDVLTHYDVKRRLEETGVHAVMTGRGALIRPWLFQEYKLGRELTLTASDRVGIYRQLVTLMKAHFGDDALGRRKAWYFFPWHFNFLHRYRSYPESVYGSLSRDHPLMLTRTDLADPRLGEVLEGLEPVERLLRCESEEAHGEIASALWDSATDSEAVTALGQLAATRLEGWEADARGRGEAELGRGGGIINGAGGGAQRGGQQQGRGRREQREEEY